MHSELQWCGGRISNMVTWWPNRGFATRKLGHCHEKIPCCSGHTKKDVKIWNSWCDTIKQIWHKYVKNICFTNIEQICEHLSKKPLDDYHFAEKINNSPKNHHQIWDSGWPPRDDTGDAAMADGYVMGIYWDTYASYYPQKMYWDVLGYIEIPMSWGCIRIYQAPKKMRVLVTSDLLPRKWKNPDLWNISSIPRFWWLNQLFLCYEFWSFNIATWPIYSWST
jgi:hypothetical protein